MPHVMFFAIFPLLCISFMLGLTSWTGSVRVTACAYPGACDINVRMAKTMKRQELLLLGLTGSCFSMVEA
jgi:hypothetical protein